LLREDGRKFDEERKIKITKNVNIYAEGSVLIEVGNTKVICTASVSDKVPSFLRGTGKGWVTAEYSMLPRATNERNPREASKGKLTGRTVEIQRLIGRALRASIDLEKLGERLITIDCDVIQADGGTRTTSITGGYIALALAIKKLLQEEILEENPLISNVAAISVGKIDSNLMVDLKYSEDSAAEVDMNVIMNKKGEFIEVQGTGEESTFTRAELNQLLDLAENSIRKLIELQDRIINQEDLKIFLATANKHKIDEISDIFSGIENIKILSIKDGIEIPEVIEDGETFEENSKKKAVEIAKFLNMITIADDSGLCVDALNGEPGVYSARYSGTGDDLKNNEKLIENLKGVKNRKAKFVSVITLAKPNGETYSFRGEIEGTIIDIPKGNTGFGYDPYFYVEEYQKTLAELPELKNKISHRAKALEKLKENLIVVNGKVNGNVKVYYENGNLKYDTSYKNNKKDGIEKIYSPDGKLEMEVPYKNGVKDGVQKQYSKDGKLIVEATLKNNLRNGSYKDYFENGKIENEGIYKDDKEEGIHREYYSNGKLKKEVEFKAGIPNGIAREYNEKGIKEKETSFKNGIEDGIRKNFYKNGNLKYSVEMKNGVENGAFKQYYENGVLEIEAFYKNGKLEGIRRDYYKSGKLEVEGLHKNGEPDGWTYVYNEDGTIKREIFFVEGKAYEKDNDKKK